MHESVDLWGPVLSSGDPSPVSLVSKCWESLAGSGSGIVAAGAVSLRDRSFCAATWRLCAISWDS